MSGEDGWLWKRRNYHHHWQLACVGIQRLNRSVFALSRWDADWHLRLGRRRKDFLAELNRLQEDEKIAGMLDLPRLRGSLEEWPEQTEVEMQKFASREFAVPRGLLTARFIRYVEGRNQA